MSDEQPKTATQLRIERMDVVAEQLLKLVESDETTETQKGRLFAQVLAWYKIREKLAPPDEGGRLKEMTDGLKSGKRDRTTERASRRSKEGHAIEKIIRQLPAFDRGVGRDPASPERPGGGAPGNGSGLRVDGGGHVEGRLDGAVDSPVV